MKLSLATPRPWRDDDDCWVCKDDTMIADCTDLSDGTWPREVQLANAALIVHCVNLHEELVAALRAAEVGLSSSIALIEGEMARSSYEDSNDFTEAQDALEAARAALAKVDAP